MKPTPVGAMSKPKAIASLHVPRELAKTFPFNPKHQVGKTITIMAHGKVVSVSQDQYGHSVEMELTSEPTTDRDGMKADMQTMKRQHTLGYSGAD